MNYLLDVNVLVAWGWPDHVDHERTAAWIGAVSATDAHLLELAGAHGARLATLDPGIPGAFLVPAKVAKDA